MPITEQHIQALVSLLQKQFPDWCSFSEPPDPGFEGAETNYKQAIAYAETRNTTAAVLVYPHDLEQPLHTRPNQIRVRSLTFAIAHNLEPAGHAFIQHLLEQPRVAW